MRDIMMEIYNALMSNELINSNCDGRIKFYEYPETADESKPFIVIDPLDIPEPLAHGSDEHHAFKYLYQIDVETKERLLTKQIQEEVRKEMKKLHFGQLSSGMDKFFNTTKRYVDARRYEGILKKDEGAVL